MIQQIAELIDPAAFDDEVISYSGDEREEAQNDALEIAEKVVSLVTDSEREACALIADGNAASALEASEHHRAAAAEDESTSGRQVEMEYSVGFHRQSRIASEIAAAIRLRAKAQVSA